MEQKESFEKLFESARKEAEKEKGIITFDDIHNLYFRGIQTVAHLQGDELAICIQANLPILDGTIKIFNKVVEKLTKYKEYEEKAKEIKESYANKDIDGKAITIEDEVTKAVEYDVPEGKKDALKRDMVALEKKYENDIKKRNELLEKECDISLKKINDNKLPKSITPFQSASIRLLIRNTKYK